MPTVQFYNTVKRTEILRLTDSTSNLEKFLKSVSAEISYNAVLAPLLCGCFLDTFILLKKINPKTSRGKATMNTLEKKKLPKKCLW